MCNKLDERFAFAISHFPICEIEMEVEQKMISKIEEREKKNEKEKSVTCRSPGATWWIKR